MADPSKPSILRSTFVKLLQGKMSGPLIQKLGGSMLRHLPGMITCAEFEEFLIDYLEERLTIDQRSSFEGHMKVCPMCLTSFNSYLKVIKMGQAVCEEDERHHAFTDAPQELIDAIIEASSRDQSH